MMRRFATVLFLFFLVAAVPALAQDADGDGVLDPNDNCVNVANAAQLDTNYDGFGNFCDPDYYNDGVVDLIDYELFLECFSGNTNPHCDLNGDGVTGAPDFGIFLGFFNGPPGPSGLACAGTIPCSDATVVGDADGDGVADDIDNCVAVSNAGQSDMNVDGFGDQCDPDYDNDGTVDNVDFEIFKVCFTTGAPACDLNGDGVTGAPDFGVFLSFFQGPPGPAGAGSQDSCPCDIQVGNCP